MNPIRISIKKAMTGTMGGKMTNAGETIRIRKVKALGDRAREEADKQGLSDDDLVIVKTTITSLPKYEVTKIEGSPTQFLQKRYLNID